MGDNAKTFTIGGGFSAKGLVSNITENFNGVYLNDNAEQRPSPSNLEKPLDSKMELTTPTEPIALKRTSELISGSMKNNSSEVGSASVGIVQNNILSEKTRVVGEIEYFKKVNPNEYDITKEGKNSKEVNPYVITEEGEHSKEVNLNKYDNYEKEKALVESKKFIGRDLYKEFKGVKTLGTVNAYITTLKLFEVFYEKNNRIEYLNHNEVLSHLAEKDKIYEVRLVEPPSLEKAIETKMGKVALGEHITSKRKMKDSSIIVGKSLSKKGKTSCGPSSKKAINIDLIEVTPPLKKTAKSKKNENGKFTKKEPETKHRPWHAKRENATKEEPYEPYQFRGLYICKERNGIRSLGNVIGYSPEMNKLIIQYKTDDSTEYMTQLETLRSMAKRADIMPSPCASSSKKKADMKEKNDDTGKASTSRTKKRTASSGPKNEGKYAGEVKL